MKFKITLFIGFLLFCSTSRAQMDTLFMLNQKQVACKVLKIGTDSLDCLLYPETDSSWRVSYAISGIHEAVYRDGLRQVFSPQVGGHSASSGAESRFLTQQEQYNLGEAHAATSFRKKGGLALIPLAFLVFGPLSLLYFIPAGIGLIVSLVYIGARVNHHKYSIPKHLLNSHSYRNGFERQIRLQKFKKILTGFLAAALGWFLLIMLIVAAFGGW